MWDNLIKQAKQDFNQVTKDINNLVTQAKKELFEHQEISSFTEYLKEYPNSIYAPDLDINENSQFKNFSEAITIEEKSEEITELLQDNRKLIIQQLFQELVPTKLTYVDFWTRFFYLRHHFVERKREEEDKETESDFWDREPPCKPVETPDNDEMDRNNVDRLNEKKPNRAEKLLERLKKPVKQALEQVDKVIFSESHVSREEYEDVVRENAILRKKLVELGINVENLVNQDVLDHKITEKTSSNAQKISQIEPVSVSSEVEPLVEDNTSNKEQNEESPKTAKIEPKKLVTERKEDEISEQISQKELEKSESDDWSNWE